MYLPEKPPYEQKKSPFNGAIIAALIIVPFAFLTMKTAISSKSTRATSQPENAQVRGTPKSPTLAHLNAPIKATARRNFWLDAITCTKTIGKTR